MKMRLDKEYPVYGGLGALINFCTQQDGFLIIGIEGELRMGKSTLMLWLLKEIYGDWDTALRHKVFNPLEFLEVLIPYIDAERRCACIGWDDINVSMRYNPKRRWGEWVSEFFENLEQIGVALAVLLCSCRDLQELDPIMNRRVRACVQVERRGYGKFQWLKKIPDYYSRFKKFSKMEWLQDITWDDLPPEAKDIYVPQRYRFTADRWRALREKIEEEFEEGGQDDVDIPRPPIPKYIWVPPDYVARLCNVSSKTVANWAERDLLIAARTPENHWRIRLDSPRLKPFL